jgi:adenosylcobinamide kinase/adenosylcobinamide-phosphate guanylyltransferase
VRSGKSAFATAYAHRLGERRVFVATAEGLDDEMRVRIAGHRRDRGEQFATVEAARALPAALAGITADVVVIDCLTMWLSNLLLDGLSTPAIKEQVEALAGELGRRRFHALLVSNEVGMGIVPETPLGRAFRDVAGWAHQRLARAADEVYVAVMGMILRVHPGPVERCQEPPAP